MKKIVSKKTNEIVIMSVVFLTIFITTGNSIVNSIVQKDFHYLVYGFSVWSVQFLSTAVLFGLLLLVVRVILYLVKKADFRKGNQGESDEKKTS